MVESGFWVTLGVAPAVSIQVLTYLKSVRTGSSCAVLCCAVLCRHWRCAASLATCCSAQQACSTLPGWLTICWAPWLSFCCSVTSAAARAISSRWRWWPGQCREPCSAPPAPSPPVVSAGRQQQHRPAAAGHAPAAAAAAGGQGTLCHSWAQGSSRSSSSGGSRQRPERLSRGYGQWQGWWCRA